MNRKKKAKARVSIFLDEDVIEFFKRRASRPHSPPYQTQINAELRAAMGRGGTPYDALLDDEQFLDALAERLRRRKK